MNKRMIKFKKYIVSILMIIFIFCFNSYAQSGKGNIPFYISSKGEILEWSKEKFGYKSDTLSFNIDEREVFILFVDIDSVSSQKAAFMFLKKEWGEKRKRGKKIEKKEAWWLFCMRGTLTNKIRVECESEYKNIILKNEENEVLLIIPFDILKLYYS